MTRILLADDHPVVMAGIEMLLQGTGYQVVGKAVNGANALDLLPSVNPDILLMDVQMPQRTGLDVLRILRSRGDTRRVVLLTASLNDTRLLEAMQLGVNGIVLKDGAEELLLKCLDVVRNGRRWIDRQLLERALDRTLTPAGAEPDPMLALSARERAVVQLVAQGLRNKEIAAELNLTEGTVKVYLHKIYERLGVSNRTELALWSAKREAD
jgi:two-component system nitrate/nitrite response regulator NarP